MVTINMPQAKPTIAKGTIVRWNKGPGDGVRKGDILAVIECDEGLIELESGLDGTMGKVLAAAGSTIGVNTVIGELNQKEEARLAMTSENTKAAKSADAKAAGPIGTVIPVVMPKAGQSVEEATLVKWRVQPGARIKKGDVIFEIETDKATLEVEAVDEGRLAKVIISEGEVAKVLDPVAYLADNDADVEAFLSTLGNTASAGSAELPVPAEPEQAPSAKQMAEPTVSDGGRMRASPAARFISKERGINLAQIATGSGPGGRILSVDVLAAKAAPAPAAVSGEVVRKRMSGMRKAIARNLLASKQNIPHFYVKLTINAEPMYAFYQGEKAKYPCSVNDVVTLAVARTVMEFPAFRSRLDKEEIVEFPTANIGIAVGMDDGLVVPVLVGANRMGLQQLGAETKRIATAARGGKVEGMGQGVFTITNLGMFGVQEFSAIINPPEAAILAVGAIREDVIVRDGAMKIGRVMTMTLSADHRIVDGMLAGKFMARLREMLEKPEMLG